jgi:4-oxalocrotonate tautomerase
MGWGGHAVETTERRKVRAMPIVQIQLVAGRSPQQKRALLEQVTDAVVSAIDSPRESVRVIITEVAPSDWAVGGVPKDEAG